MPEPTVPVFIGRERELARLEAARRRADTSGAATVIVAGEAGIGKSRLVGAFAARARASGSRVLVGSCLELGERGIPYAPFVEALRTLVRSVDPARLPGLLGPGRMELSRLLPELDIRPSEAESLDAGTRLAQPRLFELFLGLLERLVRDEPMVLVIEDIHWADESTRDLLAFLIRMARQTGVLFLVTVRSDEIVAGGPTLGYLAELERLEQVERIEVGAFGHAEVAAQVRATTGATPTDEQVEAIERRTNGNPFFVDQIVAAHAESLGHDMPPRLHDVLRGRVERLSPQAQGVLRAASAAGARVDDDLLAAVMDLPQDELHGALREVVTRQILVPVEQPGGDGRYAFRHALLRELVYGELFSGERIRLHAAYAAALTRRAERSDRDPLGAPTAAELAYHWDAARDPARALPAAVLAGIAAERVYAFAEARRHFERALELWVQVPSADLPDGEDRPSLLQRAAESAVLSGEYTRAAALGREALAALGSDADAARRAFFHERLRWYLFEAGDLAGAEAALREAERLIPERPPSGARAAILTHRAGIDMFAGRLVRSRDTATQAAAVASAAGTPAQEAMAVGILGWDIAMLGDIDRGVAIFREGLVYAEGVAGVEGIALGYSSLAQLLDRVGRPAEALAVARDGYERTAQMGVVRTYGGLLLACQASALQALGRWDEAELATGEGLERLPTGRTAIGLHLARARLDIGRGRFDDADGHVAAATEIDEQLGRTEYLPAIVAVSAELAACVGRLAGCREAVDAALAMAADGPPEPGFGWLCVVALRAEADAADRGRARRDGREVDEARRRGSVIAACCGGPWTHAGSEGALGVEGPLTEEVASRLEALRSLCQAELIRLDGTANPDAWSYAAGRYEGLGQPYPVAYARFREGSALLASRGPRDAATTALRAAHTIAQRLGAAPLQAEIELLARQARLDLGSVDERGPGTPRSAPADGGASPLAALGLTARELEVLALVAGGWTNQQIADHLFISRKTASVHVSNILGKLGVATRVEAAAVAHRLGGPTADPPPSSDVMR